MKYLLICFSLLISCAHAANITGVIAHAASGKIPVGQVITFTPTNSPLVISPTFYDSTVARVSVRTNGTFTNCCMAVGTYYFAYDPPTSLDRGYICVPDSTATWNFTDLICSTNVFTLTNINNRFVVGVAPGTNVVTSTNNGVVTVNSSGGSGDMTAANSGQEITNLFKIPQAKNLTNLSNYGFTNLSIANLAAMGISNIVCTGPLTASTNNGVLTINSSALAGTFLETNFFLMGISNIVAGTNVLVYTNAGVLFIASAVSRAEMDSNNALDTTQTARLNALDSRSLSNAAAFQPANGTLTNLAGTGAITNAPWTNNFVKILWSGNPNLYSSNGETIVFTNNIAANTLSSTGSIHLVLRCEYLQNTGGNSNFTVKVWYGSSNVYSSATSAFGASANPGEFILDLVFRNLTSSSQLMSGWFNASQISATTIGYGLINGTTMRSGGQIHAYDGADTTQSVPIGVTVTESVVAPALIYVRSFSAVLTLE